MTSTTFKNTNTRSSTLSRWVALPILFMTLAMSFIDLTVANIALPSIRQGLGASEATLSWIIAGYTLAYALSLIPAGRLGDRYGYKWVFLAGTALYVITGVFVAVATSQLYLIVFRLLHGVAGGLMIPPIAAMIQTLFEGRERTRAFGFYAVVVAVGALLGPIIGGWIIEVGGAENGWRWAMVYGLSLGVVAVVFGITMLPDVKNHAIGRFDVTGVVLMSLVIFGLFIPMIQITKGHVAWWAPISAVAALLVLVAFIFWEGRLERRNGAPLLPLSLLKEKTFSFGLVTAFLTFASFTGSIYIAFSVLCQSGRGEGPLTAALIILPFSLGSSIGPLFGDRLTRELKRWVIPASLAMLSFGYLLIYFILRKNPHVSSLTLSGPLLIAGLGSGVFFGLNMISTLSTVPSHTIGSAVGMLVTVQRIGAVLGAALVILLISQPGPGGPDDFGWKTMLIAGTNSVLLCALFASGALIISVIEAVLKREPSGVETTNLEVSH